MIVGYIRVSKSEDRNADLQKDALERAGVGRVFCEEASGARWDRPQLQRLMDQLRPDDVVVGAAPRTAGFTVYRSDHWMMKGTDLYYGDSFAADYVRFECDGVPYTFRDGLPYPTDEFGTPTNIEIIAMFPTLNREEDRDHSITMAGQAYGDGVPIDIYDTDTITPEQRDKLVRGSGILAYMPKGKGDVATAAVNEWIIGLGKDEFVDQITHNVLKRFTA